MLLLIKLQNKTLMSKSHVCVLITGVGAGSTGREVLTALKSSSNKYKIVATDMNEFSAGLFDTTYRYVISPASSPKYLETLLKICEKENVDALVTGSQLELEKVSFNSRIFEEKGIKLLLNPWKVIEKCIDKFELMKFLSSKGITCPKFYLFENYFDFKNLSYPVIIKPKDGHGSQNVFIAQDEKEAEFFCNYIKKYGSNPLIQEYIDEKQGEFTIGVLYADNGKLCTSIAIKRILEGGIFTRQIIHDVKNKERFVISSGLSYGIIDDFSDIREFGEKIAQALNAKGPINIQCRKTDKGIFPFEVNPRFSGTTGARSSAGYNEPDMFCRYLMFNEIPKSNYKFGYALRDIVDRHIPFEMARGISRI